MASEVLTARTVLMKVSKDPTDPRQLAAIAWLAAYEAQDAVALRIAEARLRALQPTWRPF